MTTNTLSAGDLKQGPTGPTGPASPAPPRTQNVAGAILRGCWKTVVALWKYLVGVALCSTGPLAGMLVLGWVYRLMQRGALRQWYRAATRDDKDAATFAEFVGAEQSTAGHGHRPNWFFQQNAWANLSGRAQVEGVRRAVPLRVLKAALHSLWLNLKIGFQAIFNTWVLTMPACALWLFSWYAGWNNSFFKLYEQFWVGPLLGWLGIVVFIAVMLYVPLAQARQACSGSWRAFYDYKLVRTVVRRRWWACVLLAAAYAIISMPIMILMIAPMGFEQNVAGFHEMTDAQLVQLLNNHYFAVCLFAFPVFIGLRLLATRIYASGLLASVRDGQIAPERLGDFERDALRRLNLLDARDRQPRHAIVRAATWTSTRLGRATGLVCALLLWFAFVGQIYVAQFFNYHMAQGWLNQPLVQLPWFKFIPAHLTGG